MLEKIGDRIRSGRCPADICLLLPISTSVSSRQSNPWQYLTGTEQPAERHYGDRGEQRGSLRGSWRHPVAWVPVRSFLTNTPPPPVGGRGLASCGQSGWTLKILRIGRPVELSLKIHEVGFKPPAAKGKAIRWKETAGWSIFAPSVHSLSPPPQSGASGMLTSAKAFLNNPSEEGGPAGLPSPFKHSKIPHHTEAVGWLLAS